MTNFTKHKAIRKFFPIIFAIVAAVLYMPQQTVEGYAPDKQDVFANVLGYQVSTPPPIPSSFYGTVDGEVNENVVISAVIKNETVAQTTLKNYEGQWVYSLIVPGDNPDTNAVEGGIPGDIVEFHIDGQAAVQTAVWQSGRNIELNLSAGTGSAATGVMPWLLGGLALAALAVRAAYLRRSGQTTAGYLPLQENK